MLLNPSQQDSAPKLVFPGDQPCGIPMLKLKDQSSRAESTTKVHPWFSEVFSANSLFILQKEFSSGATESDQSGQDSNSSRS